MKNRAEVRAFYNRIINAPPSDRGRIMTEESLPEGVTYMQYIAELTTSARLLLDSALKQHNKPLRKLQFDKPSMRPFSPDLDVAVMLNERVKAAERERRGISRTQGKKDKAQ
ncbi:MAG: hypothetical protein LBH06_08460 [Rikenellaceae bacterium]|nr:hypothetical protein [Rikenellaceae bacterium]